MHKPPADLDPEAALSLAGAGPTDRRIHVDRARRDVVVHGRGASARRQAAAVLVLLDSAVLAALVFGLAGARWHAAANSAAGWVIVAIAVGGLALAGAYRIARKAHVHVSSAAFGAVAMALAWVILKTAATKLGAGRFSPPAAETIALAGAVGGAWVIISRLVWGRLLRRSEGRAVLIFIGTASRAVAVRNTLKDLGAAYRFVHVAIGTADDEATGADRAEDLGSVPLTALDTLIEGAVSAVVLDTGLAALPPEALVDLVHIRLAGVPVKASSQLIEELFERTPVLDTDMGWMLHDQRLHGSRAPLFAATKRLVDVLGATVLLALSLPIILIAGALVKATSRGPLLFRQVRVGRWKEPFSIYKLRTMRADAEKDGARWASVDDPRVTSVGRVLRKTRIDELPQLFNVLRGHMSLVGPRPERPEFTRHLEEIIPYYDFRHVVKPGITGWAQVAYRYGATVEDAIVKLEHDIYYIKNASLAFDLRILARTVGVVLGSRGQ